MRHNYFNLNQIKSNPDGQPTVNRQSRLMSYRGYLKNLAMIFAVLVMSMANIGMAWGDTYADVYTNPASGSSLAGNANGKGAFSVITPSGGVSFGNSALQIGSNGGSGSFTVASIDGSYITSIAFTSQSSYPINTLTSDQGTITKDGNVYTFTPSSATLTSATFSMSAQSGKKVRVAPITVNLTSDHSYLSMNFGVSSGTVSCTKSTGASGVTLTTTGSASSNRLSVGSGKTLTFTSTSNIESIHFTFVNHATVSLSASTGTYNSNTWTPNSDTKTVTFTSSGSNTIGAISIKVAAAAPSCTAPTNVAISGEYVHFPGETLTLTVSGDNIAQDATYTWKKGDQVIAGQTTATLTINSCEITDAGNYTCTISNGGSCEATANYTVKMYSLRGLTDNNWTTDFVFTKVNATTATYSMELTGSSSYDFKVYDGSAYYGNTGGNPTMTSDNCTNWTMQENMGNNVTLQTTAAGTYTFTLNYTNASNPTISVTYPAKRIVYLNPDVWASDNPKFAVHAWHGSTAEDILMTKIDDCNNRNIYFAEIDAAHTHVIFIRGNKDSYNISNPWNNVWNQTGDLTIDNVQYNIGSEWNFSKDSWTSFTPNYIVTFDAKGHGTAPDAQCVAKNGRATTPAAPTATGYTFAGWYKDADCTNAWDFANDVVTEGITLYAKWTCTTPTISTQPINATYTQNTAAAALSVTATANDGTLSYQWQSSTDNSNFTNISGATGNEYTPSTTEVGTTYYRCVVTNTTGSCIVTSASATITVTAASVEPDPEPEAVPQVGTFTGAGTSGTVNLYWTMPTKPVTTTVDIASATLSAAEGQSAGATSTITKENTNEIKVEYSTTEGWLATGVKIPLATPKTNVESITFEYKSDSSQNVDFIPFLYDGTRWVESDFTKLTPTEWTSHTSVITQEAWNNSNIYSKDKTIRSVNFYANPGTAEEGTFYIRNVVLNQGTQVAAEGLIIVRKEGSNPTSPTDTDGTIVYNGDGIAATCTDNGLINGTTYHYAAYAHDGQDNYSEPLYWQYTYREELNTYAPDDTDFPNPERGFYEQVQWNANKGYNAVIDDSYFNAARAANRSLILRIYYMDSNELRQNEELPAPFITMFNTDMAKFRNNGMKCILRFAYDENSGDGYQDASPETWATHLAQLKTHLENNADVIYVVQAGFLGVWGEWYYSSQGTGNDEIELSIKNNLIEQLLAAVPANRCVQLRTPLFKKEYLASTDALTPETAYKGTAQARLGHHNDAFLNGAANQGTYEDRTADMAYIAQECLYVPIGGETNLEESQVDDLYEEYCKGTVAEAEMAQLHYSYLNYSYSTVVTNRWKAEGSYARMSKYMGYRFELASASLPNKATAGTQMNVQLNIKNVGYAPLYNERHAYIVFKNNTNTYSIQLSSDPRTWAPNSAVTPINENIALPADMVAGTYDMYLHLPDASDSIANNPKYAVRFANQGIWESETGYNKLNKQITITAACTEPTITFANGTYTVGGSVLDLSTLFDSNSNGAVTYTVTNANGTGASINGTSFTATSIGTATVKATQAANGDYCSGEATATITVNATQDPEPEDLYTVTYDAQDGSVTPTSETVSTATLPTPTKSGYTFQGWYTSGGTLISGTYNPTADITLHALWRSSECAGGGGGEDPVVIKLFDGSTDDDFAASPITVSGVSLAYTAYDKPAEASDVSSKTNNVNSKNYAKGYQFSNSGIDKGANRRCLSFTVPSGYTATFTHAFGASGNNRTIMLGSSVVTSTGDAGYIATLATTPGSGGSGGIWGGTYSTPLAAGTYYICGAGGGWQVVELIFTLTPTGAGSGTCYYVTYNGNGADGGFTTDEASHPSGSNVTVKTNGFTKTGYTFTGWNTMANGSGTSYAAGGTIEGISGNVTLYAQWVLDACSAPAAPTAFSAGSITSTGATFSITDEGDAASYDIYYSTSSDAPDEGTAATTTSDSKTKAITGLTASTTYYAWVRSVCDASHKSDWVALGTTSFTTSAGGGCTPQSVVKTVLSSTTTGTTTGYNNDEYAGSATIVTFQAEPIDGGYKLKSGSKLFVTLKKGNFVEGDKINIVITKASDLPNTTGKLPIFYNASSPALLTTIDAASADTYTYTLTASDITTLGSNKTIGVFRSSSTTENNPYVKSVEVEGCRDWTVDETAPTFVSSNPANGATGVATSGTIVLTFSEALGTVDESKFTLTGATKGAVAIDGSDATKVNIAYSGAANEATVTLATDAAAVSDLAGNALAAALSNISFTTAAAAPAGDCEELVVVKATSKTEVTATVGFVVSAGLSEGNSFSDIDGYTFAVKPGSSGTLTLSPKAGSSFAAGDSLIFIVHNGNSGSKTEGFKIGSTVYTHSVAGNSLYYIRQLLTAENIVDGKVQIKRNSSDDRWVGVIIKHCGLLPSCTTPVLSDLEDQKVCPGSDVTWTANNTEALQDGETIAYQWNKKGNNTVLSSNATLTLNDVTEATGGTYVVTAIVSADGKASKTASKEVTLTVTPATATPTITANANTIYTGNDVTLTATCASSGVGYQWYTCTDADGNGESEIGEAENAEYTFTAGEAGTYYYKVIVTGDGTHSCGTAEKVYTLIVSTSNSGETTCGEITGQFANGAYTFDTDFIIYGINSGGNHNTGASASSGNNRCGEKGYYLSGQRFVVTFPVDVLSFSFIGYQSNLRTVEAVKTTTDLKTADTEYTTITHTVEPSQEGNCQTHVITPETAIPANTFVWVELNNGLNLSEICYVPVSNVDCTDPQVTATVDNATICAGTESTVTFTATNYADGAAFQWQKKNGNAWENIDATSATYTISPVTTEHAGQYRVIATTNECSRTSEELTLTVLTAPEFNAFANTASVMKGNALTINDVEATNATSYAWYKSADATYDAGTDTKVGTTKELLLAASSITEEADQAFYLFCVASNSCGSVTSNAITVTVTPFVEEECATAGNEDNEGEHEFGFDEDTECSLDTYGDSKTPVWKTSSRSKYLTYTAPEGKYFATAKVTVAHTGGTKCGYAYSTNRGATWVVTELEGLSTTLTAITIELPANVNAFRISRNLTAQDGEKGSDSGNFYLAEACFTYENACTPTSVTATTTSYEYNISTPADFEEPPFTVKHGEEVVNDAVLTYTSSNPAIATVDEDGSVTFEGMTGTVTITAAYAGTTMDEIEYCASEGSYTITVLCEDEEPKIIVAAGTNLDGCNNSITLEAKMQDGNSFTGGTFQWYRDGEAIEGATSASYEVVRAGTYTVSRTYTCTTMSSNPAVVTNENPEPKVERLTPFQYYHVDKDYSDQMKDRHLFAVTSYGTLDGKRYHLTATRNGETLDLSSSTAFSTIPSSDNAVDTVMIDLNELEGKYNANDEVVITCAPIDNCNQVSTITSSITIHVIDQTPTLALICSGTSKAGGTRKTGELTVGGDFLTGYNVADLCQQTGNTSFDPNTEWGFYTELKKEYRVTPVNGYAQFNKLNYEPFDILLLTDYPKSSKSEAAQKIIDDMAELCDYRPLLSFKTHFQSDKWKDKTTGEYKYTKWVKKGFTTAPVVPKQTATYVNIVCYAHPMFEGIDNTNDQYTFHDDDDPNQLVYQVLTGPGYEGDKGIQGFELADADNFVTIGLVHYNAQANKVTHDDHTHISWNAEANDRLLVAMAERQTNIEARMMLFSLNCGAQSLQTPGGRNVILQCLKYLLETDPLEVADCRMTFDNGAGNTDFDPGNYEGTGTKGDGLWSTAANWGPDYLVVPGRNNDVRIAAPCIVDGVKTKVSVGNEVQETIQYYPEVLSIHITENGSLTIPANSSLTARSTILRADENGNVYPTNVADISLGSNAGGNASLILNNERGDTKAGVAMYSTAKADTDTYSAAASTWQYIGTPHSDVANAIYNYYDSWLYQYDTGTEGWVVIPNGGPLVPFRGYCVTHPESPHTYWMEGTLVSTTNQDISIPANRFVVVANSWTAPIQINELTDDDMEGLTDKSIYFFNTGSDPNQEGELNQENGRYAAGTYVSVPIRSAPYTGDSIIPSMQGFYVVGGNADGTLHLDYERHVRAKRENVPSGPMHAPARIADTDNEPQVAKFLFRGKRYDDRLIILERPDFTRGYDSGWDGEQWGGNAAAPMSYVVTETRWDAVSAIPEYEGTVIAFRAGEDSEYTIHFDYDGMEEALYLLDTETKIYTRVLKGNSYTFTCTDKAEHNRFILTRKAPQIATGVGNVSGDEVQGTKAKKLLIEDKMFIMVNGVLYDATGKVVK